MPWTYWKLFCGINLKHFKYGYVCITGATDGIGKSIAKEFARRGFQILMISRNAAKLEDTKHEISTLYPQCQIDWVQADFSVCHKDPETFFSNLNEQLKNYKISILINNVGVAANKFLLNQTDSELENMISVNVYPQTLLTYYLIPKFLERFEEKKERSAIINLSSTAEMVYTPDLAVYSATKRYNSFFSEATAYEYKKAIDIATIKPGVVRTDLATNLNGTRLPLVVNVDDYAKALVGSLRTGVSYGHWKHFILANSITFLPYQINRVIIQMLWPI